MKTKLSPKVPITLIVMITSLSTVYSQPSPSKIKEETVSYDYDGITYKSYIAYDENIKGKRPVIVVIPEWWGMTDYPKMRARMLAELGYFAMAVDMFGDGKIAADPQQAQECTKPYYMDPTLAKKRIEAAIQKATEFPQADPENIAGIGYCFGGYVILNAAKLGADLKGVVSFHGGLGGVVPIKNLLTAKLLICYGAADKLVPRSALDTFTHQLDSIGADYSVKIYANATHAFSNPASDEYARKFNLPFAYNPEADKASWNDMKMFLETLFPRKD
jgi:dienelactone hydrolase